MKKALFPQLQLVRFLVVEGSVKKKGEVQLCNLKRELTFFCH